MVFSAVYHILIKVMTYEKGYGALKTYCRISQKAVGTVRLKQTVAEDWHKWDHWKEAWQWAEEKPHLNENVHRVEEMVLSHGQPGTHETACQISRETDISKLTVFHIIYKDLKLTRFKE